MAKCEQCGATIMAGARSFAGHSFCSTRCIGLARQAGLHDEVGAEPTPPRPAWTVTGWAAVHALAPALLLGVAILMQPSRAAVPGAFASAITYVGFALYWSWPLWLWPLISHRRRRSLGYALVLLLAFIAWAALVPMMGIMTVLMTLPPGHAMHV